MADINGVGGFSYEKRDVQAQNNVRGSALDQEKTVAQKLNGLNTDGNNLFSVKEQKAAANVLVNNIWANVIQSGDGPINLNFANIDRYLNFSDIDVSNVTTASQAKEVIDNFNKTVGEKMGEAIANLIKNAKKDDETKANLEKMQKVFEALANNEPKKAEPQYTKTSEPSVDLETTTEGSAYLDFREYKPES